MPRQPDIRAKAKVARSVVGGADPASVAEAKGFDADDVEAWAASFERGGLAQLRLDFPPKSAQPAFPKPSPDLMSVHDALAYAEAKSGASTYGYYLSNALAVVMANGLRRRGFDGVLPDERGGFESRARSARGLKKLDVNYSTPEMGLGLGLSLKTISSRDPDTKRYTKNYSRNDNELRAEAVDYHRRQPYSVLAGFLFLPIDAADDAGSGKGEDDEEAGVSSFGAAVRYFRYRTPRPAPDDEPDLFEAFYVVLYDTFEETALFWPVHRLDRPPPASRRPREGEVTDLDGAISDVVDLYEDRNQPPFEWAAD